MKANFGSSFFCGWMGHMSMAEFVRGHFWWGLGFLLAVIVMIIGIRAEPDPR